MSEQYNFISEFDLTQMPCDDLFLAKEQGQGIEDFFQGLDKTLPEWEPGYSGGISNSKNSGYGNASDIVDGIGGIGDALNAAYSAAPYVLAAATAITAAIVAPVAVLWTIAIVGGLTVVGGAAKEKLGVNPLDSLGFPNSISEGISDIANGASNALRGRDPLVFRLDNQVPEIDQPTLLDFDPEHRLEIGYWLAEGDFTLAADLNQNGVISTTEIFGEAFSGLTFQTSGDALLSLDENSDLVLNENDSGFGALVAVDHAGSIHTLEDLSITEFDLSDPGERVSGRSDGIEFSRTFEMRRSDGSVGRIHEVIVSTERVGQSREILEDASTKEMQGTDGHDILRSLSDQPIVHAGGGNDIYVAYGLVDPEMVDLGRGIDTIELWADHGDSLISSQIGAEVVFAGPGDDYIDAGTSGSSFLDGGIGSDILIGSAYSDMFNGGHGDDTIIGGAGVDFALFSDAFENYAISEVQDGIVVTDLDVSNGDSGIDILTSIERLVFADQVIHLDGENTAPVAAFDQIEVRSSIVVIRSDTLLLNDIDPDFDPLSVIGVRSIDGGTVALNSDGDVEIHANGPVLTFEYSVSDGHSTTSSQVDILVNDLPQDSLLDTAWHLDRLNVVPVWSRYDGAGVNLAIHGFGYADNSHPDLSAGFTGVTDLDRISDHETAMAGLAIGAADGSGMVGVASGASWKSAPYQSSIWFGRRETFFDYWNDRNNEAELGDTDIVITATIHEALRKNGAGFAGANNYANVREGLREFAETAREGKGGIAIFAAGNGEDDGGNFGWRTDYHMVQSDRTALAVTGITFDGQNSDYHRGVSVLVAVPADKLVSPDILGEGGYSDATSSLGEDFVSFRGTSGAAPIAGGVVALLLDANPDLGWRDIKTILAISAVKTDILDAGWADNATVTWNGGGFHFNEKYGFGVIDAQAAVSLAETWSVQSTSQNEWSVTSSGSASLLEIDRGGSGSVTLQVEQPPNSTGGKIEYVELHLDAGTNLRDVTLELVSPGGTVATITRPEDLPGRFQVVPDSWHFTVNSFRDERAFGDWEMRISRTLDDSDTDPVVTEISITARLEIFGASNLLDHTYFYTDEMSLLDPIENSERFLILDSDEGIDGINASATSSAATINLNSGAKSLIAGQLISISEESSIENAFGTGESDVLIGNAVGNLLVGGFGRDVLFGLGGSDTLDGGSSNDLLYGEAGNDRIIGGAGHDLLEGGDGEDVISGGSGSDTIVGGHGFDFADYTTAEAAISVDLSGNSSSGGDAVGDILIGIEGLIGSPFDDVLTGSSFDDVLIGGLGRDTINGGEGEDTASYEFADGGVEVSLNSGTGRGAADGDILENIENLIGTMFSDTLVGAFSGSQLSGLDGNDSLIGLEGDDSLVGGQGHDSIWANEGADTIASGAGADTSWGGDGDDLIFGDAGNDVVAGDTGDDTVNGDDGDDHVTGGDGNDLVSGGSGDDLVDGGAGEDLMEGGSGADVVLGNAGNDHLRGDDGDDSLFGQDGSDTLIGGMGDDYLDGGEGIDSVHYEDSQTSFTLTLSPTATTITDRSANGTGTDQITSIEFLDFGTEIDLFNGQMNLQIFGGPTDLSTAQFGEIIELYIAYFNRAPDAIGLNYWATEFTNGFTLPMMAENFFQQVETRETYGNLLDSGFNLEITDAAKVGAFVTEVYANVLGRTPDDDGFGYWTDQLISNSANITPGNFILSIIGGAKFPSEPTEQTALDQAYLATKADLGAYFAVIKGMSDLDDAAAAMAVFDGSEDSIAATLAAIDGHYADALDPETGDFLMPLVGVIDDPFALG